MTGTPESSPLGTAQRWVLVLIAVALAMGLVVLRGGIQSESPMEQLARRSLDPQTALTNGRPTLIEFYADWCQVCREMAPSMLTLEKQSRDRLDVVLVNVDNPRWQDLVDRYDVNGIPQLNLFNAEGKPRGDPSACAALRNSSCSPQHCLKISRCRPCLASATSASC